MPGSAPLAGGGAVGAALLEQLSREGGGGGGGSGSGGGGGSVDDLDVDGEGLTVDDRVGGIHQDERWGR